jgi:hypothetical protein
MRDDTVRLTVVEQVATTGACALCATNPASLVATVLVHHARGAIVDLVACDRCTRVVRRLVAVMGNEGPRTAGIAAPLPGGAPASAEPVVVVPRRRVRSRPRVLGAELLLEYSERLLDVDGTEYVVRAWGGPRSDGVWVGWLEFAAVGQRRVRRTGQETTQRRRADLEYWATGLEPVYLQGAFARAG